MRILLDECVHAGVRAAFSGYVTKTVANMGWRSTQDQELLSLAQEKFTVFVTIDRNLVRQLDLDKLKIGIILVRVRSNMLACYQPLFDELRLAAELVKPGKVIVVPKVSE